MCEQLDFWPNAKKLHEEMPIRFIAARVPAVGRLLAQVWDTKKQKMIECTMEELYGSVHKKGD